MTIFLIFYCVYAAGNVYVFLKVRHIFHPGILTSVLLGLFLAFMTFSPTLIHLCSSYCPYTLTKIYAYPGYMWVAVIVFFSSVGILLDLYNFIVRTGSFILQNNSIKKISTSQRASFFITVFSFDLV